MKKLRFTSFAATEYNGHDIVVRTFGSYFDFLFVHKGKIHTAFLEVKPDLTNYVLYLLGRKDLPYSEEQVEAAKKLVTHMAEQVIDELCQNK